MRAQIAQNLIKELGHNEDLNSEVVLSLNPDLVMGFGIDGINKSFETLKNGSIPVVYNGDWAETSPLAKAEWIKVFGELYGKQNKADSIFNQIEQNYIEAKTLAKQVTKIPTVLSGAMHQESWYLPYGTSPEGQFLEDANVNYLWKDTSGSGSMALSFESVFVKAQNADIWINPSAFTSYEQLASNNPLYKKFKAFQSKSIYSMSLTKGTTGGVLYYELGFTRPDLVLKDLIKICHPSLLKDYQTTFFKPLKNGGH
jgi:iron complex transport system substrate-binding protein